jgi:hypothetical protein
MLLENGKHEGLVKGVSLFLRGEAHRLTGAFKLNVGGVEVVHREYLELNDGTLSEKTVKRLQNCFPKWDGAIENMNDFAVEDTEVEVTARNEQDKEDANKYWTRTEWMQPRGTGGDVELPQAVDSKSLAARYGAKFRALSGGKSVAKTVQAPAPAKAAPSAPKAAPKAPAAPVARVDPSTLEACWEAFSKAQEGQPEDVINGEWFKLLGEAVKGKDQGDFDADDWGRVMVAVGKIDNLPY